MNHDATTLQPFLASITIGGSGRVGPTIAALIGLTGTVVGALALARSRRRANAAVALGVISLVLGGLFLATADGGPGTGNGVVGSAVAIVLGPIAIVLGRLARARSRPPASSPSHREARAEPS